VHEAYLRLVDTDQVRRWDSQGHFFAAAAEAMRRILVDQARRKRSLKRGGLLHRLDVEVIQVPSRVRDVDLLSVDEALDRLASRDAEAAEIVKLRYFVGLTLSEAAQALGVSERTAARIWTYARSFLAKAMGESSD
jgi:RNA polymerase sigma factor (TIGR02999 family)